MSQWSRQDVKLRHILACDQIHTPPGVLDGVDQQLAAQLLGGVLGELDAARTVEGQLENVVVAAYLLDVAVSQLPGC
jgi:hypothetical protein